MYSIPLHAKVCIIEILLIYGFSFYLTSQLIRLSCWERGRGDDGTGEGARTVKKNSKPLNFKKTTWLIGTTCIVLCKTA